MKASDNPDKKTLRKRKGKPVSSPDFIETYRSEFEPDEEPPQPRSSGPIQLSAEEAIALGIENAREG